MIEEAEVEDDIDIDVERDGRGFEGGCDLDAMGVWEDVSRNSAGAVWSLVTVTEPVTARSSVMGTYLWGGVDVGHESGVLPISSSFHSASNEPVKMWTHFTVPIVIRQQLFPSFFIQCTLGIGVDQ